MIKFLSLTAIACVLAGCAASPTATSTTTASADEGIIQTGSRIPYRTSDRLLRTIGGETYKNDDGAQIRSITNITGARGN